VGFIPEELQYLEGLRAFRKPYWFGCLGKPEFLIPLGKTHHITAYPQFIQDPLGSVHLTDTAVDKNQIRQFLPFPEEPGVTAVYCLPHGGKVIHHPHYGAELKVPVVLSIRDSIFEGDKGGYRMFTIELGNIKALNPFRSGPEPQNLDQFVQGRTSSPILEPAAEVLQGILPGHGQYRLMAFFIRGK
jgi:hypothetical protein